MRGFSLVVPGPDVRIPYSRSLDGAVLLFKFHWRIEILVNFLASAIMNNMRYQIVLLPSIFGLLDVFPLLG